MNLYILIMSTIITILVYFNNNTALKYTLMVLSSTISLTKAIYVFMRIDSKGVYFKHMSIRFKNIKWSCMENAVLVTDPEQKIRLANYYNRELDQLDFNFFKLTYSTSDLKNGNGNSNGSSNGNGITARSVHV